MGILKKDSSKPEQTQAPESAPTPAPPTLARRKLNRNSTIRSGRTIGEKREKLETRNERIAARKKDKKKATRRVIFTTAAFIAVGAGIVYLCIALLNFSWSAPVITENPVATEPEARPTIEVVDEDASAAGGKITSRMLSYIAQAEQDLRDQGYTPTKAVIPTGAIREVDFYLDGYPGFIKMTIDRGSAVSAEDTARMLRYLASINVSEFQYIDVRIDGRAYWK